MKRIIGLLLAIAILLSCVTVLGEEKQNPLSLYTRIDPATGKPYNLKGKTVYFYDYWSGNWDWHDEVPEGKDAQSRYNYRKWLEKTYNCKIYTGQKGDWGSIGEELNAFVQDPDGSLSLFTLPTTHVSTAIAGNLIADWKKSESISLSDRKWNKSTVNMMTFAGGVYGVYVGETEPRQVLFFNKRVLEEAGIDWNSIYDMQKAGTWTWSAFEKLLKAVTRDIDGDGFNDIWGIIGSSDDLYRVACFSNGGSFFDLNSSGKLVTKVTGSNSKDALKWGKKIWSTYSAPKPEEAAWDWYREAWKDGYCGFYMSQAYSGYNLGNYEMIDMADPWGAVAFPKGPKGKTYVTLVDNNVTVIPNVYSAKEISQVTMLYDLWTCTAPDIEEDEDVYPFDDGRTDERAIYETYKMLTEDEHNFADKTLLLGNINEVLGSALLWQLAEEDLDELLEAAKMGWNEYLTAFNNLIKRLEKEKKAVTLTSGGLVYELDKKAKTAVLTGAKKTSITSLTIPDTVKSGKTKYKVTRVADQAFKDYKKLAKVKIGSNVSTLGAEAFSGCVKLKTVSGGDGLVVIGDRAFRGCSVLAAITLGKNVASIGDEAFRLCKKLVKIIVKTVKLNEDLIGKEAFDKIGAKAVFECPAKMLKAYKKLFPKKGAPKTAKYK